MAELSDPQLCSTDVVEDALNHDDVVGLRLSYVYRECFFTVLIAHQVTKDCHHNTAGDASVRVIHNLIAEFNEACTWTEKDKTIEDIDRRLDSIWQEAEDIVKTIAFDRIKSLGHKHGRVPRVGEPSDHASKTLDEYLLPETFNLQLMPDAAGINIAEKTDLSACLPWAPDASICPTSGLIRVTPKEARILNRYRCHVLKVQVKGLIYCCKLNNTGVQNSLLREFEALQRVRSSPLGDKIRIPQLKGVVETSGGVIGLLIDWIETDQPDLMLLLRQSCSITESTKREWADEISHMVRQLHALNLTWGDAKTSNILIDKQNRPWIIDFGGGFTRGWVDEALYDTQAGDLQGLENTFLDIFGRR